MAKEQVQITFSANSAQARQLFQEIADGMGKVESRTKKTTKEIDVQSTSLVGMAKNYITAAAAVGVLTKAFDTETQAIQRRAAAWEKHQSGMQRVAVEGGLSPGQERAMRGAITQAGAATAADSPAVVQQLAASLLEARFSPETLSGGGLLAAQRGLTAINATGAGADPTRMGKSLANIMQATGAPMTAGGIESTMRQMHALLNATGAEMGDVEAMMTGFGRITPKKAKALSMAGLRPEDVDPRRHGAGGAIQAWFKATAGMDPAQADMLASRVFGDTAATALRRAQPGFDPSLTDPAGFDRDLSRATSGPLASIRRQRFQNEMQDATRGGIDAEWEQALENRSRLMEQRGWPAFLRTGVITAGRIGGALSDSYREHIVGRERQRQAKLQIEIRDVHGTRASGHVRGTEHLRSLEQ